MFFAEGEEKEFPEDIKSEIHRLESKDREIYELNQKKKNIDSEVIDFVIESLEVFLKYEKELNKKQKDLMTGAIGDIPITFFILDKLKVKKEIKEAIGPLVDIYDSHCNLHINREKLIWKVLNKLKQIQEKTKK